MKNLFRAIDIVLDCHLSLPEILTVKMNDFIKAGSGIQSELRNRLRQNREYLTGKARVLKSGGGWYAVINKPESDEFAVILRLLEEKKCWLPPGHFYDFPDEGNYVLSLLPTPDLFNAGVENLISELSASTAKINYLKRKKPFV